MILIKAFQINRGQVAGCQTRRRRLGKGGKDFCVDVDRRNNSSSFCHFKMAVEFPDVSQNACFLCLTTRLSVPFCTRNEIMDKK